MAQRTRPAQELLTAFGLPAICDEIANGGTMTDLAQKVGVTFGSLNAWIAADPDRVEQVRGARQAAARLWDEAAAAGISSATEPFELAKARELAFHYRWRASKIAPAEYGDRTQKQLLDAKGNPTDPVRPPVIFTVIK